MTGQKLTIDAKVDTGAAATIIPKRLAEGLSLPALGNCSFTMVDGTPLTTEARMCRLSFSDDVEAKKAIAEKRRKAVEKYQGSITCEKYGVYMRP